MSKQTDLINVTDAITVDSSNNVGIGTSSPATVLHIDGAEPELRIQDTDDNGEGKLSFVNNSGTECASIRGFMGTQRMVFNTNDSEAMRIDSSGNLLVGKTVVDNTTQGARIYSTGRMSLVSEADDCLILNRRTSDGPIAVFRKNGSTVGSIGVTQGIYPFMGHSGTGITFAHNVDAIMPYRPSSSDYGDGLIDIGRTNGRFDDIYATNGTIQTSDRNEKQDIEALSDAEQRVAVACKGLLRKFRWIDAVSEKGDDARIHFGIIAQDLQDAFTAEGLDAGRYAMFISTTWWETQTDVPAVEAVAEVLDDDGNVVTEAVEAKDAYTRTDTYETLEEAPEGATERTRLGVRYPELLAFIIGAM